MARDEQDEPKAHVRINRRPARPVVLLRLPKMPEGGVVEIYHSPDGKEDYAIVPEGTKVERPRS